MAATTTGKLPFTTLRYLSQIKIWPDSGKHILANYDDNSIIVYQAFNPSIAEAAVKSQNFHHPEVLETGYKTSRMTWVKTNFLWMMYRSGWASKKGQERILAIRITRIGFEEILRNASTTIPDAEVRLQWDPDHFPDGGKVPARRAIQLGLRGEILERFSREFIVEISDITDFVKEQYEKLTADCEGLMTPEEKVYQLCNKDIRDIIESDELLQHVV